MGNTPDITARFVFLHYHIFKNGGTTIDWILARNFPNAFAEVHEDAMDGYLDDHSILKYLHEHPNITALSSHHFRPPFLVHPGSNFIEICFLRHPLDRLQSMYHFYKRDKEANDIFAQKAKQFPLPDFLAWLIDTRHYMSINAQTCFIARSGACYFPPSEKDLEKAETIVENIKFLGIVERFDESLVAAEHFLKPAFPNLDLSYIPQNLSQSLDHSLPEKLAAMKKTCGNAIYQQLERLNELDERLLDRANRELSRRLRYIPNLEEKLINFKAKCRRLAEEKNNFSKTE